MSAKVEGRTQAESCPACRGYCAAIGGPAPPRAEGFGELITDAFAYPFRGSGISLLIVGGAFFGFIDLLSRSWRRGLFFLIFGLGYLSAFLFRIVASSAAGEREPPGWPEFTDLWESVAIPFLQMAAPWVACLAPAALPFFFLGWTPAGLGVALAVAGVMSLYLPMAILAIAVNDSVGAMHPGNVLPAIRAVPGPYLVIWGLFAAVGALSGTLQALVAGSVPFVGFAVNAVVSLYFLMVEMRLLGLLYCRYAERMQLV
jgi:hypothetical protein